LRLIKGRRTLAVVGTKAGREAWQIMQGLMFSRRARDRMQQVCAAVGLPQGVAKALIHLSADQPTAMRDLAEHWQCDASYVTALVDRLEEQGIAERRPHPTDRRVKTVVLTAHGTETRARLLDLMWEPPPPFAALTAAEQRQLRDLLRKVAEADQALDASEQAEMHAAFRRRS